ncbi:MAG: DUF2066 domain-containing protein [bacterium]
MFGTRRHRRRRRAGAWFALTLALLAAAPAGADEVPWLYDVRVPVADQSPGARIEAGGRALAELLTRITGLASVPRSDPVNRALAAPDLYDSQFGFERGADGGLELGLQFVPDAVLKLVREARLPVWRANRPRVVAWIVVEDASGERAVLGTASDHPVAQAVRERARQRGLPLQLPLMDLEDQLAVDPAAVWGRLSQTLLPASERYGADIVLVGRLQQVPGGSWIGRLGVLGGGRRPLPEPSGHRGCRPGPRCRRSGGGRTGGAVRRDRPRRPPGRDGGERAHRRQGLRRPARLPR